MSPLGPTWGWRGRLRMRCMRRWTGWPPGRSRSRPGWRPGTWARRLTGRGWRYSTCRRRGWRARIACWPPVATPGTAKGGGLQIEYGLLTDPDGRPVAVPGREPRAQRRASGRGCPSPARWRCTRGRPRGRALRRSRSDLPRPKALQRHPRHAQHQPALPGDPRHRRCHAASSMTEPLSPALIITDGGWHPAYARVLAIASDGAAAAHYAAGEPPSLVTRKLRVRSAIWSACSSRAKWPPSSRCTSAPGTSRL